MSPARAWLKRVVASSIAAGGSEDVEGGAGVSVMTEEVAVAESVGGGEEGFVGMPIVVDRMQNQ